MVNDTSITSTFLDHNKHTFLPTKPSSWLYDTGLLIEKGSIVLSRVESTRACPDLDQPYLHKCVVLLVEHKQDEVTQGIILNRPTDLRLDRHGTVTYRYDSEDNTLRLEEFNEEYKSARKNEEWRMFFGGEIDTLQHDDDEEEEVELEYFDRYDHDHDDETVIVCLHNISSPSALQVSETILPGVYMTSHQAARSLIASGDASPESFYLFYGFCGWDPDQLQTEVQNGSWYLASTDPQTLWNHLAILREENYDTRLAGVAMWEHLIQKLGKTQEVQQTTKTMTRADNNHEQFPDLMLHEWVTQTLAATPDRASAYAALDDASIYRALHAADRPPVQPGSLLRGASMPESPYLLDSQFLHKSTVLVLQENDKASIGMVLNLPTSQVYSLPINNSTAAEFTIRYGGTSNFATASEGDNDDQEHQEEEEAMVWLHCSAGLKYLRTGKPLVAGDENGVWTCTQDQVAQAIDLGFAAPDDFMLVKGFCQWHKEGGSAGGVLGQVMSGYLEVVASDKIDGAWTTLRRQTPLSEHSLDKNLQLANEAWIVASDSERSADDESRLVFGTSVTVSELADMALSTWINIHLLQDDDDDEGETMQ